MPEKFEPQIFRTEEIPEKKKEEAEFLNEIELSKKEEPLAEQEKLILEAEKGRERALEKLEEKIAEAEEILARKEEVPLEEKTKLISRYIKAEAMRDGFKDLTHKEIEKMLVKQESTLVFHIITEQNQLWQKMKENSVEKDQIENFVAQRGDGMLPDRIHKTWHCLNSICLQLDALLTSARYLFKKGDSQFRRGMKEESMRCLKALLVDSKREFQEWQKYQKFEREKEEKPMRISGFETFDFPGIRGKEIIEKAAEILPRKLLSTNVKEIKYLNIFRPVDKEKYGFDGETFAFFSEDEETEETKEYNITFYQVSDLTKVNYLDRVLYNLAHEFGHSLDPKLVDQKDLTPGDQLQMIIEWEEVRAKEDEWSSYVLEINNQKKQLEEALKSQESLAESTARYLFDPRGFQDLCPQRYEFLTHWFKKRFPDFNLGNNLKARMNYSILMENLKKEIKKVGEK